MSSVISCRRARDREKEIQPYIDYMAIYIWTIKKYKEKKKGFLIRVLAKPQDVQKKKRNEENNFKQTDNPSSGEETYPSPQEPIARYRHPYE